MARTYSPKDPSRVSAMVLVLPVAMLSAVLRALLASAGSVKP